MDQFMLAAKFAHSVYLYYRLTSESETPLQAPGRPPALQSGRLHRAAFPNPREHTFVFYSNKRCPRYNNADVILKISFFIKTVLSFKKQKKSRSSWDEGDSLFKFFSLYFFFFPLIFLVACFFWEAATLETERQKEGGEAQRRLLLISFFIKCII